MNHLDDDIREELLQDLSPRDLQDIESALHREYVQAPDVQAEWEKVNDNDNVNDNGNGNDQQEESEQTTKISHLWSFLSGVAAAAVIFFLFTLFNNKTEENNTYVFSANQNSKEVLLSDGSDQMQVVSEKTLDYNSKASNIPQATKESVAPKMLSLTTPRGKDYHVKLSDGTEVWMNADSKLEFPEHFTGKQRKVKLQGEAYFQVTKNAAKPFIVETEFFKTTVLGTTFNVKAYSAKDANIVLIEGSVEVCVGKNTKQLHPSQQAIINPSGTIALRSVDTYPYTQWREGFFYFENQSLFDIMQELGRWYNINIAFDDPQKMNTRLHFVAKRTDSLSTAIKNMNDLGVVDVELNSDAVVIK
ncbi:MAG: FecR domain-containing protein [Prevotella sp.]|nr:FecR domain-containing protein [Prevotella sp.]